MITLNYSTNLMQNGISFYVLRALLEPKFPFEPSTASEVESVYLRHI